MHIFGYIATGVLMVCILLAATKSLLVANAMVIAVADVAQAEAPDATQSPPQPTPSPILQQQNQTDRALERSQRHAEEEEDLLKHAGLGSPRFGSFAIQPQEGCNEHPPSSCHCRDCVRHSEVKLLIPQ